ncbi:MAG: magnesium/cobalt transporter CorA [Pseudomonadota bacterium]
MRRKRLSKKSGLPPGSLVYVGESHPTKVARITLFDFDEHRLTEKTITDIQECLPFASAETVTWINVDGIQAPGVLESFGKLMGFHPLMLEDILHTYQRPKHEDYGDYIFIVMKVLDYDPERNAIIIEQLSLVLGPSYLISFQESSGDTFDPLRERIRKGVGRVRKMHADFLAYALMDSVVDHYFDVLEKIGEQIESLETILTENPTPDTLRAIHDLRRELIFLRKSVWPLREVIGAMQRSESKLLHENTDLFLRDLQDHVVRVAESIDTYRDMLSSMQEVYLSSISNRTNEVVKVLTLFSSIFLPLTFITGIFGMNFHNFPQLDWAYGFQATMVFMLLLGGGMYWYFKSRHWL